MPDLLHDDGASSARQNPRPPGSDPFAARARTAARARFAYYLAVRERSRGYNGESIRVKLTFSKSAPEPKSRDSFPKRGQSFLARWLWQVENMFLTAAIRDSLVHVNLYGTACCVSNATSFHARIGPAIDVTTCHNYL
jgi:hypothetical protein